MFALVNPSVGSLERSWRGVSWFTQAMTYFPSLIMLLLLGSQINKTFLSAYFPEERLTILNYSHGQHENKRMCCKTELFNSNSLSRNSHSFPLCCCMPFFLICNICFPDHKNSLIWRQWVDWTYTNTSWLTDRFVSLFCGEWNYQSPYFWLLQFAKGKKLAMNFPPLLIRGRVVLCSISVVSWPFFTMSKRQNI